MTAPLPAGPALIRVASLVGDLYAVSAEEAGVTVQQARLLFVLHHGSESMLGLGAVLRVGKSTMTGVVERMESAGLVTRGQDPDDRRKQAITLTPSGARVATRFERALAARVEELLAGLEESERTTLAETLSGLLSRNDA